MFGGRIRARHRDKKHKQKKTGFEVPAHLVGKIDHRTVKSLKEQFLHFDGDGSGSIDLEELAALLRSTGLNPTLPEVETLMEELDEDNSGTLCFQEFVEMWYRQAAHACNDLDLFALAFKFFDKDGNGQISSDEFKSIVCNIGEPLTPAECDLFISQIDGNGDGSLCYHEFLEFLQNEVTVTNPEGVEHLNDARSELRTLSLDPDYRSPHEALTAAPEQPPIPSNSKQQQLATLQESSHPPQVPPLASSKLLQATAASSANTNNNSQQSQLPPVNSSPRPNRDEIDQLIGDLIPSQSIQKEDSEIAHAEIHKNHFMNNETGPAVVNGLEASVSGLAADIGIADLTRFSSNVLEGGTSVTKHGGQVLEPVKGVLSSRPNSIEKSTPKAAQNAMLGVPQGHLAPIGRLPD